MTRILLSMTLVLLLCATAVQSQDSLSTTRLEAQHQSIASKAKRLVQYEENLLKTLENENPTMQAQAVQTVRELEQIFPKYSFKSLIAPLGAKLKDENADGIVRQLAALALDELHSDAGDAFIKEVATSSQNKSIQTLCSALLVRSQLK